MKTLKEARQYAVIGSKNSKMPGTTYSQTAFECPTGKKLAEIPGTVCHGCYAVKLQKLRPSVNIGWTQNFLKAKTHCHTGSTMWRDSIVQQLNHYYKKSGYTNRYHRWFDGGDLISVDQLLQIMDVCDKTPWISHWLPTQEREMVKIALEHRECPDNLVIRISGSMVNGKPPATPNDSVNTSTVSSNKGHYGFKCPAREQGNNCRDCRACWSHVVSNVSYTKH